MVHCRYRKQQSSSIASSIGSNHSFRAPSDSSSFNHGKNFPITSEVPLDPNEMNSVQLHKNRRNPQVPYCPPRNGNGLVVPSSPRHQVSGERINLNSQNANIHVNQQYPFNNYQHQKGSLIHCSPHHGPIFGNRSGINSTNSPVISAYSSVPIFTDNELKKVPSSPRHQIRAAQTHQQSYQQPYSEGKGSITSYHSNNRSDGGSYKHRPTNTNHNSVVLPEESAHYDYSTINYGNFC